MLGQAAYQSYEVSGEDTINVVDEQGLKQGYWKIYGRMRDIPGFSSDQVIEEGRYEDSRKEGLWKKYFPSGDLKSKITYHRSRPRGPYTTYYKNGNVQEKGSWKYNKNTGEFKRYHKNGNLAQEFYFNESGKREGQQKYYFENGNLEVSVEVENGKEDGVMKRYYSNGELKEKKVFKDGKVDPATVETYNKQDSAPQETPEEEPKGKTAQVDKGDKLNEAEEKKEKKKGKGGISDGFHTFYNDNKQVTKTGYFKDGKLYKGKWKKYDENGILEKIEIYRKGIYIGDGVIEEEDK